MHTITLTDKQLKSVHDMLDYLVEHETEDFVENHLDCDPVSSDDWAEVDKKILDGKLDVPHIYISVVHVWAALRDQGK